MFYIVWCLEISTLPLTALLEYIAKAVNQVELAHLAIADSG